MEKYKEGTVVYAVTDVGPMKGHVYRVRKNGNYDIVVETASQVLILRDMKWGQVYPEGDYGRASNFYRGRYV